MRPAPQGQCVHHAIPPLLVTCLVPHILSSPDWPSWEGPQGPNWPSLPQEGSGQEGEGAPSLSKPFSMRTHSKILCVNCVIMYMGKDVQIYVLFVADMILYL